MCVSVQIMTNKTLIHKLLDFVNSRTKPFSVTDFMVATVTAPSLVYQQIMALKNAGLIDVDGALPTGGKGRPCLLYKVVKIDTEQYLRVKAVLPKLPTEFCVKEVAIALSWGLASYNTMKLILHRMEYEKVIARVVFMPAVSHRGPKPMRWTADPEYMKQNIQAQQEMDATENASPSPEVKALDDALAKYGL